MKKRLREGQLDAECGEAQDSASLGLMEAESNADFEAAYGPADPARFWDRWNRRALSAGVQRITVTRRKRRRLSKSSGRLGRG